MWKRQKEKKKKNKWNLIYQVEAVTVILQCGSIKIYINHPTLITLTVNLLKYKLYVII